jgi:outer membrane protein assembly factor BamB
MASRGTRFRWLVALVFGVAVLTLCGSSSSANVHGDGPAAPFVTYHGNNARTGFTTNTSITATNATSLHLRWSMRSSAIISNQPIVAGNTVYWADWSGHMHATSTSGQARWSTFLGVTPKPKGCPYPLPTQGIVSSPTVGRVGGRNLLWVGGGAGQLVALNASSGRIVWQTRLRTEPGDTAWSSPALYNGSIYEGMASFNDCPVVNGSFDRINATTGAIQAVNHLSQTEGCIGPGVWSSPSVDPSTNSIYVSTSNANLRSTPSDTCESPDQEAILQLDATTLAVKSVWKVPVSKQASDSDFGASPMLFTATIDGVERQLIGAENKNGVYYVLDRTDLAAGPAWTYTAETTATVGGSACQNVNTLSPSAWAGPGSPVIVAGIARQGSNCLGTLAALNPATGQPEWQVPLSGTVLGAVTEVPGLVAVGAGRSVVVLSASTGKLLYSYTEALHYPPHEPHSVFQGWFWGPTSISGPNLYAGNEDGHVRVFTP